MEDKDLLLFFVSRDGASVTRTCCALINNELRRISVIGLGNLLLRVWAVVDSDVLLEGIMVSESLSDTRRLKEDFVDFATDLIKMFSSGVLGKYPKDPTHQIEDSFTTFQAYCDVLAALFNMYNQAFDKVKAWNNSLLGITDSTSNSISEDSIVSRAKSVAMVPLVKAAITVLCADPYLLLARWEQWHASGSCARLISGLVLALLNECPADSDAATAALHLMTANGPSSLSLGADPDETVASRTGARPLLIAAFAEEWVLTSLTYEATSVSCSSLCASLYEIVSICQHDSLILARYQVRGVECRDLLSSM